MLKIKVTNNSYEIYKEGILKEKGKIVNGDFIANEAHCNSLIEVQEIYQFKKDIMRGNIRYKSVLPLVLSYKGFLAHTNGYDYEIIHEDDEYLIEKGRVSLVGTVLIPKVKNRITEQEEIILREISQKLIDYLKQNIDIKLNAYEKLLYEVI